MVHKDHREMTVPLGMMVSTVQMVHKDHREMMVSKEMMERKVL
jgi:hypothetical protein